jgi:hypothetical protein
MVVNNLNISRSLISPTKTNSELVIDTNTPLALSVAAECLKAISRWHTHIIQVLRQIELNQFAQSWAFDACPFSYMPQPKERFGISGPERFDHGTVNNEYRY